MSDPQDAHIEDIELHLDGLNRQTASEDVREQLELKDTLIEGEVKLQAFAPAHVKFEFRRRCPSCGLRSGHLGDCPELPRHDDDTVGGCS